MSVPRAFLERLSRGLVFRRHLPSEFGRAPIMVSPDASMRYWKPFIQSDLFDFAREFVRPGSVVWDVGANVGLLAIAAARLAGTSGRVVAIEPDVWLTSLLRHSAALQLSSAARIQVIPAAVFGSLGIASFNIARRARATNFLSVLQGSTQTGGVRETVNVLTITLDWLLEQGAAPSVLKIDVEGAEAHVLGGARRVLAQARPVILTEVNEDTCDQVTEILFDHEYTLFDFLAKPRRRVDRATFSTLAVPAEPCKPRP
jgi:FkbM family methyltransferase